MTAHCDCGRVEDNAFNQNTSPMLVPEEQTMDVPKEQEQPEQAKPSERLTTAKMK